MKKTFIILICMLLFVSYANAKELYRASSAGDKGTYYILSKQAIGDNTFQVLTSRIGKNNAYTDFTELKINCNTMQYYTLAGSEEDGAKEVPSKALKDWSKNSKWTSLVTGSSKYDLTIHVCE